MMDHIKNFINGKFTDPVSGKYLDVYEPATGEVYCRTPASGKNDVEEAYVAAQSAFPSWSQMPVDERADILDAIANGIEADFDTLAAAESRDTGKPVSLARSVDLPRAISNFHTFADMVRKFNGQKFESKEFGSNTINYEPLGVVGCISPWNLPLYLFSWKIAPALATGNCVIGKPSELTPFTAQELGRISKSAGLPDGVLNIIHGSGPEAGSAITTHPGIKAISFTGGTKTGAIISRAVAPHFKKLSLELGGKNPNIIFSDCDFERMLETTLRSSFSNQGEICLCSSRILVEEKIYEEFRDKFIARTNQLIVGDPMSKESDLGALISEAHLEKVKNYIQLAKDEGGSILAGGEIFLVNSRCKNGWFISPTIIEGLGPECRTNQEEIFGPVVTLIPFSSEEESVEIANATEYGLSASIWTDDLTKAERIANKIESGVVWINCWMVRDLRTPFGGMKNSGLGREGGEEAFRFFTEAKTVCIKAED